jgi:hypothetical protein
MKALPWVIGAIGIGVGVTYMLFNTPQPQYATGSDTIEDAAHKAFGWGTKQRAAGKGQSVVGASRKASGGLPAMRTSRMRVRQRV